MSAYETLKAQYTKGKGVDALEWAVLMAHVGISGWAQEQAAAELLDLRERSKRLEALLREVTTSIEFDELGLRDLHDRIRRELVP